MNKIFSIDWWLFCALIPILSAGLITMNSFGVQSAYFTRQIIWIVISFCVFFAFSTIDFRFLKRPRVLFTLFVGICGLLTLLFIAGHISKGAQSWFRLGFFSVEPSDPAQIVLILILAKYFSRRHIEIQNVRHILVSGFYSFIMFVLILIQPDLGAALIMFFIWLGMVLVSGISKRHIFAIFTVGILAFIGLWMHVLKPYQKARILTFANPVSDIHGAGYNAYQSTIAVGSGQLFGKGIGYGTQSKLNFLPEYRTDFIFAAFAEEWGFVGVIILFTCYGIVLWRILRAAMQGASNFEVLYALGLVVMLTTHLVINVGMNIGLMPVTGVTIPFMSYGGSHLVTEFTALGILMGMNKYGRRAHRELIKTEVSDVMQ
jgi:rod shape determining protein RodA